MTQVSHIKKSIIHILFSHTKSDSLNHLTAGLEKTLRLLQALTQIIIAYALSPLEAQPWAQVRKQINLGKVERSIP
jgi:hypothetical protein